MRNLGEWLTRSSQLEGYAAGVALRLTRGKLVTAEERDYLGDVIFPQELLHRDILWDLANEVIPDVPAPLSLPNLWDQPETDVLMLLTRGEGALLLEERKFRRMMDAADRLNDTQYLNHFLAGFSLIADDERGHRAWSRQVVHRLLGEGRPIPPHVLRSWAPFHAVHALVEATQQDLGLAPAR